MARQYVASNIGTPFSVSSGPKTVMELKNIASALVICEIDITFDGTTASAVPCKVDICRVANTCTGTALSPVPPLNESGQAATTTVKFNATAEGASAPTPIIGWYVPPTSGMVIQFPLGREPLVFGNNDFIAVRLTPSASVNAICTVYFEE